MKRKRGETRPRAFVLMPFDEEFDKTFHDLITPALEQAGYEVQRADSIDDQQNILKDVVRGIAEADLVVADLTSANPNVFYELGISHAMRKPTVLLTQSIEDVPFDLKSYRMIRYSLRFDKARQMSEKLTDVAHKAITGNIGFGNPVMDFLRPPAKANHEGLPGPQEPLVRPEDKKEIDTEQCSRQ